LPLVPRLSNEILTLQSFKGMSLVSVLETAGLMTVSGVIFAAALAIYRITWHPLAKYPGPRLAAMTGWYETYYDCFLLGKFSNHLDEMHRRYGKLRQPSGIPRS
jgi:hypothetical protein